MKSLFIIPLIFILFNVGNSVDNGLAKTPQMGWNSWNYFNCKVTENDIKKTADKII